MGHATVSNTTFKTECCFLFLITKTTIQQRCPWPLHIYGGLKEISLPPPWALITPGRSPRPPSSCHSPWAAKAARMLFHLSTAAPGRVVGKSQVRGSGNEMRSNERMRCTKERAGGRRPPLLSVALSMAHPSFSSLLSLSSGPVKGRASSFLLHTLKSIGYRGVLNLKLCKPCQISVRN